MKTQKKAVAKQSADDDQLTARELKARLDAIVMLLASIKFSDEDGKLKMAPVAKLLKNVGFGPTEIARFFGKTKATDVSKYLY